MNNQAPVDGGIDPRIFREVMGHYPTGVVMVAGLVDGAPSGMVVGTFSSVSMDPPLVAFMPQVTSTTYQTLRRASAICISVLAHDQMHATRTLASRDPDKFEKVPWTPSAAGAPQIDGAVAYIHGRIEREVEAGDHWITLVRVDDLAITRPTTPLLFFQGGYGGFSTRGMTAHVDHSLISAARVAEAARPQLDALADSLACTAAAIVQIGPADQMIGASSYGGTGTVDERIGVHLPLIPPLGDVAVAWNPTLREDWARRTFPPSEEAVAQHLARAAEVRAHGYGMMRIDGHESMYRRLARAIDEYARGELTPARDREVKSVIADSVPLFDRWIHAYDREITIAGLSVPVFAPDTAEPTNSGLTIRLSDLPERVDPATVRNWVALTQTAASEVTETLRTSSAREYGRYTATGLRGDGTLGAS